jgi:hypothetical protein
MITVQSSADAGRLPSCGSVAPPLKLMFWPTCHVKFADGAPMVAVGGWLPAAITIGLETLNASWLSVTFSRTV